MDNPSPRAPAAGTGQPQPPPNRHSPLSVALICALGVGCVMYDQTSLVVTAPTIIEDFGSDLSGLQWLVAMFSLVAASAMPVSGLLGRRWGGRTTVQIGLAIFAAGGVIAATAPTLVVLLAARVCQGIGAALVLPNAALLIGGNISDPVVRARSVGRWMTASSSALLLGPLLGGLFAEHWGWRTTFVVYLPVALLGILLFGRLRNTPREPTARIDFAGLALACAILATLSWALIASGSHNPVWWLIGLGFAVAALLGIVFVNVERRVGNPLLDVEVFRQADVRRILLAAFSYNAVVNGTAILFSVYFQDHRGFGSTMTGMLLLFANLGMPLAGLLVNGLAVRWGNGRLMAAGLFILATAFLILGLGGDLPPAAMLLPLLSIGLGAGILYYVDTSTILKLTSGPRSASAMAALALMRQIGSVLGIAALASIGQLAVAAGLFPTGEPAAFVVTAVLRAAGGSTAVRLLRARRLQFAAGDVPPASAE